LEWRPKAASLFDCATLKKLFVNRYKGRDVSDFGRLVSLESLAILNAPIANLHGFKPLEELRSLRLATALKRRLEVEDRITSVSLPSLETEFD
jgi:hypothetical protein